MAAQPHLLSFTHSKPVRKKKSELPFFVLNSPPPLTSPKRSLNFFYFVCRICPNFPFYLPNMPELSKQERKKKTNDTPQRPRRKKEKEKEPQSVYTMASFVAAISRASTSGVSLAKAFFVPSGLLSISHSYSSGGVDSIWKPT